MTSDDYEVPAATPSGQSPDGRGWPAEGYYEDPQGRVFYLYDDGAAFYCDQNRQTFSEGYIGNVQEALMSGVIPAAFASFALAVGGAVPADNAIETSNRNASDFALADSSYVQQRQTRGWERGGRKRWSEFRLEEQAPPIGPKLDFLDQKRRGQMFNILIAVGLFVIVTVGVVIVKKKENAILALFKNDFEMVFVQGGTFNMGCTKEQGKECLDNEKPVHSVSVSDFYIGKYEVTQEQWVKVLGENPSRFRGENLPVEGIEWEDTQKFIKKLNLITGKRYRLPTEAEWEYAARGGSRSNGYMYAGGNYSNDVMWHKDNSDGKTHTVGGKKPNELGIYDMSGNVSEWVSDWFGKYNSSSETNPKGPNDGWKGHVRRGGCWDAKARDGRVAFRGRRVLDIFESAGVTGFRLAISP